MSAGFYAMLREQINRLPTPQQPTEYVRVRVTTGTSGFQYRTRSGELREARPGDIVEVAHDAVAGRLHRGDVVRA